jgi:demethylmenaquinone methyltransferase/2-methoxy-6-polyprenyl-1,4-benzoquinol methylase
MTAQVQSMFAAIAGRYDTANTVLSLGIHHRWRARAVELSAVKPGMRVLDCATGTGDLALAMKRAVGKHGEVTATDFCEEMLSHAPAKAQRKGLDIHFQVADAMALPFEQKTFDVASIAFGIRNVDNPVNCLSEMARVVKQGGRVVVLEFGQPTGVFGALFRFYSNVVLPRIGGVISGNLQAYQYLNKTAARFPAGQQFVALMEQSGAFSQRLDVPLMWGLVHVYVGTVA